MDRLTAGAKRATIKHEKTFDAVMATLVRSITSPPPNTTVHLVSDPEVLLDRLIDEGIAPGDDDLRRLAEERGGKALGERRLFDELVKRLPAESIHEQALRRLQKQRELFQEFIYNRLGIYRVNFFLSIYGDFMLCHAHPFLPNDDMVIGPRFYRAEGEKLQRQLWLIPLSARRKSEQAMLEQLWNHSDLSVLRAQHWLASPEGLTPWEQDLGDVLFFSEGLYYFSAFERAYRFGLPPMASPQPKRSLARRESDIGSYLGLTRRGYVTRRWEAVAHWWEAATYGEIAARFSQTSETEDVLDRLLELCVTRQEVGKGKRGRELTVDRIKDRVRMIPKLHDSHPVARFVAKQPDPLLQPPELLRILGRAEPWSATRAVGLLKTFFEENCDWSEGETLLAQRIRPVIDVDVFANRDFNALIFPLGLRRMKTEPSAKADMVPDLTGMVFISTQLDFLDDWHSHRFKLNQIRAIFTLLGNLNLEVALQTEVQRSARIRHILHLVDTFASLWPRILPEAREKRSMQHKKADVLVALARELRNVRPKQARERIEVLLKQLKADQEIPRRLLQDLSYYSETSPVQKTCEARLDSLAKSVWASHIDPLGIPARLVVVAADPTLRVEVEQEAIMHVFENLLLNAVEAIHAGAASTDVEITLRVQSSGGFLNIPAQREVVVSIADRAFEPIDRGTEKWFEPGYSTKAKRGNYGFGLASAWKTVARHGGRIWANRSEGQTVVQFALPLASLSGEHLTPNRSERELSGVGAV